MFVVIADEKASVNSVSCLWAGDNSSPELKLGALLPFEGRDQIARQKDPSVVGFVAPASGAGSPEFKELAMNVGFPRFKQGC